MHRKHGDSNFLKTSNENSTEKRREGKETFLPLFLLLNVILLLSRGSHSYLNTFMCHIDLNLDLEHCTSKQLLTSCSFRRYKSQAAEQREVRRHHRLTS